MEQLEKKLLLLLEELKKARDPEKGMPENPVRQPKATVQLMGANKKPVLSRRHKVDQPKSETQQAGDSTEMSVHGDSYIKRLTRSEICKFDKNGQWSIENSLT